MKKVFSKEKFIEVMGYEKYQEAVEIAGNDNYVDFCNRKTGKECAENGWLISDDWCVEVEDEI